MRTKREENRSVFDRPYPDHRTGRLLAEISKLLDGHPEFLDWVGADVDRGGASRKGRRGLSYEVILRAGILKQLWQLDYRELEFALMDSSAACRFTRD